jgi:adenylate kinase family enzyme
MKIYILGGSGSGKTTLAEDISVMFHVPHYELDQIGLKNGKVTEDDAFAIAEQPEWITDGPYLIWTDPLLYQADYIVLLEISWLVAAWRIIRRHITKSLHGTNPYPGLNGVKLLFKLLKDNRKHYLNQINADTPLAEYMREYLAKQREYAGPPTPEHVRKDVEKYLMLSFPPTAEFLRKYLEKYQEKVFVVKNKADRERLLVLLAKR